MPRFFHSLHRGLVFLLVGLLSLAAAVPAGAHLEICIGNDGHWEIGATGCGENERPEFSFLAPAGGHHTDCSDSRSGCGGNSECRTEQLRRAGHQRLRQLQSTVTVLPPRFPQPFTTHRPPSGACSPALSTSLSFHLPTTRAVVLLI